MKKIIAIALALMLCVGALSLSAFAAFEVDSLAIVGSGIPGVEEWKPESASGDMEEVSEGVFVKEIVVEEACTMKIKFAGNDAWVDTCNFGSGTLVIDGDATELECAGHSSDMTLEVAEPCTLKFTVDLTGDVATAKVETVGGSETPETPEEPETPETPETPEEPETPAATDYYVAGVKALCGAEWSANDEANKMTAGDNGVFTKTYTAVAAGEYELKVTDGTWDNSWGNGTENYKFTVTEACDIVVTFDSNTNTVSVTGDGIESPVTGDMSLAAISVALLAATAGLVAIVSKKED